jgi:hypothetical protein
MVHYFGCIINQWDVISTDRILRFERRDGVSITSRPTKQSRVSIMNNASLS